MKLNLEIAYGYFQEFHGEIISPSQKEDEENEVYLELKHY